MKALTLLAGAVYIAALSMALSGQQPAADGPQFVTANGRTNLVRPANYREWIFLSSGLGMTYQPPGANPPPPQFGNVFVNPSSYRTFLQTGRWPNGTIFVLEFRSSGSEASINKAGRFQTGLSGLEAEVKDARFPDGWAYFNLSDGAQSTAPLDGDRVTTCIECHTKNTAVERTFVQFYPTLFDIARQKGTLKPGF